MGELSAQPLEAAATDQETALRLVYDPVDPACQANPVPYYQALLAGPPLQVDKGLLTTLVGRYRQVVEVLRDHKRFSSVVPDVRGTERYPLFGSQNFTFTDAPVHTRLRRLVASGFAPKKIEAQEVHVRASLDRLYEEMEAKGEIEFVTEFANRLPLMTVGKILEWPDEDFDFLRGLILYLFEQAKVKPGSPMPAEILKEFTTQREYFTAMINKRRQQPGQDLISAIISARDERGAVDDEELLGLVTTLVLGGVPTTSELLTFMIYELLNDPRQREMLRDNPGPGRHCRGGNPALRSAGHDDAALCVGRHRSRRGAYSGRQRGLARDGRGQSRPRAVPKTPRPSTSPAIPTTIWPSAKGSISVSARPPPGSRAVWWRPRFSRASRGCGLCRASPPLIAAPRCRAAWRRCGSSSSRKELRTSLGRAT